MDKVELQNKEWTDKITKKILKDVFQEDFPRGTHAPIFECHMDRTCFVP